MRSLQHKSNGHSSTEQGTALQGHVVTWCQNLLGDNADEDGLQVLQCVADERVEILKRIGVDEESLAAAWLYSAWELVDINAEKLRKEFGPSIFSLVSGIKKMDVISRLSNVARDGSSGDENFRKMLIAIIDDVRIVLVRLACQVQRLRAARDLDPEPRQALARETQEVLAPLANRLGIWQLKWELEDYAFRYLNPDVYKGLARRLAERRIDRERYIEGFMDVLENILQQSGIHGDVAGRPKHIYSIYKKMQKKGLEFDNINDVRAVRILVDDVSDCYAVLGLVHTRWPHISGEFDDYIATPKENGYRSIHTAIVGPEGKVIEVQIRTFGMHEDNELGVAAHWRYKESGRQDATTDSKILWLRQLLEWKQEVGEGSEFFERFRNDTSEERVYVFSPRGKVVDLPQGSTPLDFAYSIHTDVGHQCRGAKVNGRMVPLNHRLNTGEQVDILTIRSGTPSRDWLNPGLGYIHTQKARSRIQRWFKEEDFDHNLAAGRSALERELYRLGASDTSFEKLSSIQKFRKVDDFLAAIGSGDIKLSQAVSSLRPQVTKRKTQLPASLQKASAARSGRGMEVQGVGNLLTNFAACCSPLPGDEIVGYITQGRGITVHRRDCGNILRLDADREDRLIHVQWGVSEAESFPVDIEINAIDRKGLLYDVSRLLSDSSINVLSTATQTNEREHTASMRIRIEIGDVQQLSQILAQISRLPNVTDARRIGE